MSSMDQSTKKIEFNILNPTFLSGQYGISEEMLNQILENRGLYWVKNNWSSHSTAEDKILANSFSKLMELGEITLEKLNSNSTQTTPFLKIHILEGKKIEIDKFEVTILFSKINGERRLTVSVKSESLNAVHASIKSTDLKNEITINGETLDVFLAKEGSLQQATAIDEDLELFNKKNIFFEDKNESSTTSQISAPPPFQDQNNNQQQFPHQNHTFLNQGQNQGQKDNDNQFPWKTTIFGVLLLSIVGLGAYKYFNSKKTKTKKITDGKIKS